MFTSLTSINSKDEEVTYNNSQLHEEVKEGSMGWNVANGHIKDNYSNENTDNIEILFEQLRNAQDDVEVCQFLEALVGILSNQKVRSHNAYIAHTLLGFLRTYVYYIFCLLLIGWRNLCSAVPSQNRHENRI